MRLESGCEISVRTFFQPGRPLLHLLHHRPPPEPRAALRRLRSSSPLSFASQSSRPSCASGGPFRRPTPQPATHAHHRLERASGIPSCDGSNYAFCGVRNRQAKPVPCRRLPESAAAPCRAIQNCHPQVIGLSCLSVYIYRPTLRLAAVFPPHPSRQTQPSLFFSQPRHSFYELGLRICTYTH